MHFRHDGWRIWVLFHVQLLPSLEVHMQVVLIPCHTPIARQSLTPMPMQQQRLRMYLRIKA